MDTKQLFNVLASTIGEIDDGMGIPEGHLYAGCMAHCDLSQFQTVIALMADLKLIERRAGPCVIRTEKLRAALAAAKAKMGGR